jgi:hypothetical protein
MLTLMPLSDAQAVSAYLVRIEDMLRAQFGTDFSSAHIGVYTLGARRGRRGGAHAAAAPLPARWGVDHGRAGRWHAAQRGAGQADPWAS